MKRVETYFVLKGREGVLFLEAPPGVIQTVVSTTQGKNLKVRF